MAEKRMFSKKITDSDAFADMSSAAQALYFHLNQNADDDGFNNQVSIAMFRAHASPDDLKVLLAKNYIIRFENGVIVIKHWRLHNTLRKDRYNPTSFKEEFEQLGIKEDGSYTLGCRLVAERLPDGCHREEKSSFREEKSSGSIKGGGDQLRCLNDKQGKGVVYLTDEQDEALMEKLGIEGYDYYISKLADFIINKNATVKNHYETILKWHNEDSKVNV
jgi:hypothetical protein